MPNVTGRFVLPASSHDALLRKPWRSQRAGFPPAGA